MTRTIRVYRLTASEAAWWDVSWDYENPGPSGEGWYWDSEIDGRPSMEFQGPYSTRKMAERAAR